MSNVAQAQLLYLLLKGFVTKKKFKDVVKLATVFYALVSISFLFLVYKIFLSAFACVRLFMCQELPALK